MSPASTVGVLIFQTLRWNPTHMSDAAWLALIGLATVIVAAVPATVTALTTRHLAVQARDHAAAASDAATNAKKTLGEINGNGDVVQMLSRVLGLSTELLHWQERSVELERELLALHGYSHDEIHRLQGRLDVLTAFARQRGFDPDDVPLPEPSPKENQ